MPKYEYWLTEEGLIRLQGWAREGLTDEQIAECMGIDVRTLYRWKKNPACSQICQALKESKEIADRKVENALYKRALGYRYSEDEYASEPLKEDEYQEKLFEYMNRYKLAHPEATDDEIMLARENFPKTKEVLVRRKVKEVVPDTTAQIFWLKNRNPEKWRDKQEVKVDNQVTVDPFDGLTTEELRKLISDE